MRRWSRSVFLSKDVISTGTEGIKEISFFPPCCTASTAKYKKFAQSVEKVVMLAVVNSGSPAQFKSVRVCTVDGREEIVKPRSVSVSRARGGRTSSCCISAEVSSARFRKLPATAATSVCTCPPTSLNPYSLRSLSGSTPQREIAGLYFPCCGTISAVSRCLEKFSGGWERFRCSLVRCGRVASFEVVRKVLIGIGESQ